MPSFALFKKTGPDRNEHVKTANVATVPGRPPMGFAWIKIKAQPKEAEYGEWGDLNPPFPDNAPDRISDTYQGRYEIDDARMSRLEKGTEILERKTSMTLKDRGRDGKKV